MLETKVEMEVSSCKASLLIILVAYYTNTTLLLILIHDISIVGMFFCPRRFFLVLSERLYLCPG